MEFNATFLISAISFIVFVFIMNAIFYKPVLKIMEERKEFINKNEQDISFANLKSEELLQQKEKELAHARAEAKVTVDDGSKKFKAENKSVLDNFASEQKIQTENEKSQLNNEAVNSKEVLKQSSNDISKIISNKILGVENV